MKETYHQPQDAFEQLIAPFSPHMREDLWQALRNVQQHAQFSEWTPVGDRDWNFIAHAALLSGGFIHLVKVVLPQQGIPTDKYPVEAILYYLISTHAYYNNIQRLARNLDENR